jgi:RTX calcium-binding nonapeptide repeat (4 copies)
MRRVILIVAGVALLAGVAAVASVSPSQGAVKITKRCWPGDKYHSNNKVPAGVKHPSKYGDCGDCAPIAADVACTLWYGGQTPGGGDSVSHKGWPGLTGIRWQVVKDNNNGEHKTGSKFNDGLYGRNGSDTLKGGDGRDVLWGDASAKVNGSRQKDKLDGGPGSDWIYTAKGSNSVEGGSGDDHIFVFNGHGTVDCGSGDDVVTLRSKGHYKLKRCEKVRDL